LGVTTELRRTKEETMERMNDWLDKWIKSGSNSRRDVMGKAWVDEAPGPVAGGKGAIEMLGEPKILTNGIDGTSADL